MRLHTLKTKIINQKKYKTITTILRSLDTIVIIARTSSSITLSLTGIGLIVIPISTASARALSIGKKVIDEIVMQKYNKYKKQNGKDQHKIKFFDKLLRKSLQDIIID